MKCSKESSCKFNDAGECSVPFKYSSVISTGLEKIMEGSSIPSSVASKVSSLLDDVSDASDFCEIAFKQLEEDEEPKVRILDRAIVNKFEQLYDRLIIKLKNENGNASGHKDFFKIVPRGECLNLLLDLIRDYCIGDYEFQKFRGEMEALVHKYTKNDVIEWLDVYSSDEYESIMDSIFSLLFKHVKKGSSPIPALNTQMHSKYHPVRINKLLVFLHSTWLQEKRTRPETNKKVKEFA